MMTLPLPLTYLGIIRDSGGFEDHNYLNEGLEGKANIACLICS